MKKNEDEDKPSNGLSALILLCQLVVATLGIGFIALSSMPDKIAPVVHQNVARDYVAPYVYLVEEGRMFGTGFDLRVGNRIITITNRHVCQNYIPENADVIKGKKITVNGKEESVIAISETENDLCAITSSSRLGLKLAEYEPSDMSQVITVGYPEGFSKMAKDARVIKYEDVKYPWNKSAVRTLLLSGRTFGGQSGSPVVNLDGDVVGVMFVRNNDPFHHGGAVPLAELKQFLKEIQ
jgi:S1-C subfamily serine protease